jgi:hypothetical protein
LATTNNNPRLPTNFFDDERADADLADLETPLVAPVAWYRHPVTLWMLLVLTLLSTAWSGLAAWSPVQVLLTAADEGSLHIVRKMIVGNWLIGLQFSVSLVAILGAHELGHYFMTLYYRIPATPPIFIPFPIQPFGTMGAVIAMDGSRANKKQIFDIGIAGPLAGLVVAIPIIAIGLKTNYQLTIAEQPSFLFGMPLIVSWMSQWLQPELMNNAAGISNNQMNPFLMAGWTGLLITGLNMMPFGQLDGGHVIYGLLRDRAIVVSRAVFLLVVGFVALYQQWHYILMLFLVLFLVGLRHPPSRENTEPLGWFRHVLGWATLSLPILCIATNAIRQI